jgi:hypothetical protein
MEPGAAASGDQGDLRSGARQRRDRHRLNRNRGEREKSYRRSNQCPLHIFLPAMLDVQHTTSPTASLPFAMCTDDHNFVETRRTTLRADLALKQEEIKQPADRSAISCARNEMLSSRRDASTAAARGNRRNCAAQISISRPISTT